jgi:hypothetical protein
MHAHAAPKVVPAIVQLRINHKYWCHTPHAALLWVSSSTQ